MEKRSGLIPVASLHSMDIQYDVQLAGGLKSMVFGGEGLFLATLSGFGTVWLQSLPFSRLADRVIQCAPSTGGKIRAKAPYLEELVDWLMGIDLIQIEQNEIKLSPSFLLFFSFRFLP